MGILNSNIIKGEHAVERVQDQLDLLEHLLNIVYSMRQGVD